MQRLSQFSTECVHQRLAARASRARSSLAHSRPTPARIPTRAHSCRQPPKELRTTRAHIDTFSTFSFLSDCESVYSCVLDVPQMCKDNNCTCSPYYFINVMYEDVTGLRNSCIEDLRRWDEVLSSNVRIFKNRIFQYLCDLREAK